MRRLLIALAVLAATALSPSDAPAQVLKLATLAPEGSPWHDVIIDIGKAASVRSRLPSSTKMIS